MAVLGSKASKWLPNQEQDVDEHEPDKSEPKDNASEPAPETAESAQEGKGKNSGKGKGKAGGKSDKESKQKAKGQKPGEDAGDDARAEEAAAQLGKLHALTGQPLPTDEVLYALTMCAPYSAVGGPYKFRVKITPGQQKKSQAAKTCLSMFEAQCESSAWKQLVRTIPDVDTTSSMCGSAKLSMPGIQKLQDKIKKEKQKESKEKKKEKGK